MNKRLELRLGALSQPIATQLKSQGYKFNKNTVEGFEQLKEALITVNFSFLFPDSQYDKAINKFFKQIEKHVMIENKMKKVKQ